MAFQNQNDGEIPSFEGEKVLKLSDMVCHVITRRDDLTAGAVRYLPHKFTSKLLKFALQELYYPSLKLLLPNFRGDVLSLNAVGVMRNESMDLNRVGTAVIRAFFESLEERIEIYVKTLDVTGFPISGPGLAFLTVHGMLAHSEAQRTKVLKVVERAKELGRISMNQADSFGDLNLEPTITPGAYSVLFDCRLSDTTMVQNLAQALKVSQWADRNFLGPSVHLGVHRIHFINLDIPHVLTVVELIEPECLRGIKLSNCLKGEILDEEGTDIVLNAWVVLAEVLQRFSNLDSLEVNAIGLRLEDEQEEELATRHLLKHLPKLERLSFWMSRIRGRLRSVLQVCQGGLCYLNLRSCNLSPLDLMYLSQASIHTASLTEIDLSENVVVSDEITTTCCLLKACRRNLHSVLLAFCGLQTHHFDRLIANLAIIPQLKLVDVRFNMFDNAEVVCSGMRVMAPHETLQTFMISPPVIFMAFEERDELRREFMTNVDRIVTEHKSPLRPHPISVIY